MRKSGFRRRGILAAAASAVFLGLSPIFGKIAIQLGFTPFSVVAIRTTLALLLLFFFLLVFNRKFFFIYPIGLVGCLIAGLINGIGSIFYYTSLARIDAGIGQLIYSFYPLFMIFWLLLDRQTVSHITLIRLLIAILGVYFLLNNSFNQIDLLGALYMLIAAILYALHLLINQRVLFDVPAPTVTFYTLAAMSFTVLMAFFIIDPSLPAGDQSWWPLLILAMITFLSRVTLFFGVKHLGGIQTALLGLGEILVTVVVAQLYLGERFSTFQWIGTMIIFINLLMVVFEKTPEKKPSGRGFLHWLHPPFY